MVSSRLSPLSGINFPKPDTLLSLEIPNAFPTDLIDLDFSDVFGPTNCVSPIPTFSQLEIDDPSEFLGKLDEEDDEIFSCETEIDGDSEETVRLEDFEFLKLVGQGAFGKVYQVRKIGSSQIFAMKVMRKDKIMEKNHADYMKAERDILTKIDHPFIVQLRYSFQTKYRLYLVLDFVNGGHLFFQLYHQGLFREDLARIYAAEIVSAVCHLHAHGVMHRDLKPENILLDAEGHLIKDCPRNMQ